MLIFGARTALAAWLVFPTAELNPQPPPGADIVAAYRLAPSSALYQYYIALELSRRYQRTWPTQDALILGERARDLVTESADRLPTNPFFQLAAGRLQLQIALHGRPVSTERSIAIASAAARMRRAVAAWPQSPMVQELAGLALVEHWGVLAAGERAFAIDTLRKAVVAIPRRTNRFLNALWSHAVVPEANAAQGGLDDLLGPLKTLASTPETSPLVAAFVRRHGTELPRVDKIELDDWLAALPTHERNQ